MRNSWEMGNNEEISEKYLGNKREKPGTGHRRVCLVSGALILQEVINCVKIGSDHSRTIPD